MRTGWILTAVLACTVACFPPNPAADMPWVAYHAGDDPLLSCPAAPGFDVAPLFAVSPYGTDCLETGKCETEDACLAASVCDADVKAPGVPRGVKFYAHPDEAPTDNLPNALSRYCLYVPRAGTSGNSEPEFVNKDDLWTIQRSQRVVAPAASTLGGDLRTFYALKTDVESGLCSTSRTRTAPVRLVFVDSAPTGSIDSVPFPVTTQGHGEALALGIDERLCGGDPDCLIDVRVRAALPLRNDGSVTRWTVPTGGQYGSLEWVAQAIVREVNAWQKWAPDSHLVLNLSLGWHPDYGGGGGKFDLTCRSASDAKGQVPPDCVNRTDVHAVYQALRFARCHGALVFAAAGNRFGGGQDNGPLYPAAWEASTVGDCLKDFGVENTDVEESPVVYAVGAVGADDQPLAIARDNGEPRLVAYGHQFHGEAAELQGLLPLTGTSAAAAIVAGAVAQAWSEQGETTGDKVLDLVYEDGEDLGRAPAGPFAPPAGDNVHRVRGACIPESPTPPETDTADTSLSVANAAVPATIDQVLPTKPSIAYDPFAHPQPTGTYCPVCAVDMAPIGGGAVLYVDLPLFPGTVDDARLATYTGIGTWSQVQLGTISSPSQIEVQGIPGTPIRAMLMFSSSGQVYFSEIAVL